MKLQIFFRLSLLFPCLMLCFLCIVPEAGAEQPVNGISNQVFASEGLTTLKGPIQTEGVVPAKQRDAAERETTSSFDIRFALNEKFNAVISVGEQTIRDFAGRDSGRNYHAGVGVQLLFK